MSRPASLRWGSNPFIRPKKKSGSQKLGLDFDKINLMEGHKREDEENREALRRLRAALSQAEREGKHSKAKKLRRLINQELEVSLYLTRSFCQVCHNVLHRCSC